MNRKQIISACLIWCMAFTPASAVYAQEPAEAAVESQVLNAEQEEKVESVESE